VGKEKNFIDYVILSSYLPFGKIGVYLFVMITGYFLGNRLYKINKSINKAFIVWSEAFFYSLIIYLILVKVKLLHFSIKQFINACLPFTANQYWFVTAYIMLLLLLPFINRVIVVLNKRQYIYLIIIVSFLGSFLASIKNSTFASEISFGYLIPPYLIGGYLNKYKVNINWLKSKIIFLYLVDCNK
jgi:hypothetical protein